MGDDGLGGGGDVGFWRAEAARWRAEAEQLAGALAQAQGQRVGEDALRARIAELEGQVGALAEKVSVLTKTLFGTSSEKKTSPKPAGGGPDGAGGGGGSSGRRGQRRGSRGHGRRDYAHLRTREEVHDVPEGERVCPCCGAGFVRFGEESCEQIDWVVELVRVVHRRPTYRRTCKCPVKGVLVAPPVPKAIAKGRFTTGFLARLVVEKFVLGRPVHRIVAALAHDGLDLAEGTAAGVLAACAPLLAPLAQAIAARNSAAAHLHVDETSWNVYAAVEGKDGHRWWCWVFVGADTTVFEIAPSRSLKVLTKHLGVDPDDGRLPDALPEGRQLLLSSDFYAVYQAIGRVDGVDNLWCWSHVRRYFVRAGDAHPELVAWTAHWVELIGALYVAHTALGAADPDSPEHATAHTQFCAALDAIDTERAAQGRTRKAMLPAAAKALATLDREWDGLARHREHPELPLDNNTSERALRGPVVGRKNFYGSGSQNSAELAGHAWTITATAARHGLNPLAYLTAYLDACARNGAAAPTGQELARYLPWAATDADRAAWAADPRARPGTAGPPTPPDDTAQPDPRAGPAP